MIDSLAAIDWSKLEHAYGDAADTPGLIRQLWGEDWPDAVEELLVSILHQGNVYPATVAAIPFLTEVAARQEAPGRLGALHLLHFYGQAVEAGATESTRLDTQAREALRRSARVLLPSAADPDPEVRIAVYECACYWPGSAVRQMVRDRFAAETDTAARVALIEPLARHRLLTRADLEHLRVEGPDQVLFAALWSGLAVGLDLPWSTEHLARLWPFWADRYPGSGAANSLDLLVREAGAAAGPLLHRLEKVMSAADLAEAWLEVARMSRGATPSAVEAVIGLSARVTDADQARRLAAVLVQLLPAAGEHGPAFADAAVRLLDRASTDASLEASVATILFALRDPRWAAPARAAVASGQPVALSEGSTHLTFPTALAAYPLTWAHDELIEVARIATTARPSSAASWTEVLGLLPASPIVADILVEAAHQAAHQAMHEAPAGEPVVLKALTRLAATHPEVFGPAARATIAALPVTSDEPGAWLLTAQAQFTGQDVFARVWSSGAGAFEADELLRIWARQPSPEVDRACRSQLTGEAATSIPARHLQLVAASFIIDSGHPAEVWPTVRALLDRAGEPLAEAVSVANRIAEREPGLRPQWLLLLHDIAANGRPTWSGTDHRAVAIALRTLLGLGELSPEEAVERALRVELEAVAAGQALPVTPVVAAILAEALELRPDLRPRVAEALGPLTQSDTRIPSAADDIATDLRLRQMLLNVVRREEMMRA